MERCKHSPAAPLTYHRLIALRLLLDADEPFLRFLGDRAGAGDAR